MSDTTKLLNEVVQLRKLLDKVSKERDMALEAVTRAYDAGYDAGYTNAVEEMGDEDE